MKTLSILLIQLFIFTNTFCQTKTESKTYTNSMFTRNTSTLAVKSNTAEIGKTLSNIKLAKKLSSKIKRTNTEKTEKKLKEKTSVFNKIPITYNSFIDRILHFFVDIYQTVITFVLEPVLGPNIFKKKAVDKPVKKEDKKEENIQTKDKKEKNIQTKEKPSSNENIKKTDKTKDIKNEKIETNKTIPEATEKETTKTDTQNEKIEFIEKTEQPKPIKIKNIPKDNSIEQEEPKQPEKTEPAQKLPAQVNEHQINEQIYVNKDEVPFDAPLKPTKETVYKIDAPIDPLEGKPLNERLKSHVYKIAGEIGARNINMFPEKLKQTEDYITNSLKSYGYNVDTESQRYKPETNNPTNQSVCNIIAEIKGTENPDEQILVTAHYDSCHNTPGADDNGSAVAGALEIAKALAKTNPKRTIRFVFFVFFVNEEPPFYRGQDMGSRVYTKKAKENKDNIKAVINLEMIGYFPTKKNFPKKLIKKAINKTPILNWLGDNYITVVGHPQGRQLTNQIYKSFKQKNNFPIKKIDRNSTLMKIPDKVAGIGEWLSMSDHGSFWEQGFYNAVMITDTAFIRNPHYHGTNANGGTTDTPDTLNYEAMTQVVDGFIGVVEDLASISNIDAATPNIVEHNKENCTSKDNSSCFSCSKVPGSSALEKLYSKIIYPGHGLGNYHVPNEISFNTSDGVSLKGVYVPAYANSRKPNGVMLFSHGNCADLRDLNSSPVVSLCKKLGLDVFFYDYRNPSKIKGNLEKSLTKDAEAAFKEMKKQYKKRHGQNPENKKIVSSGQSLGAALAIHVAYKHPEIGALFTQCGFTNIQEMIGDISGSILPKSTATSIASSAKPFITSPLDSLSKIQQINMPKLIMHGTADRVIPPWMGKKLKQKSNNSELMLVNGAGHNDVLMNIKKPQVISFFKRNLKIDEINPNAEYNQNQDQNLQIINQGSSKSQLGQPLSSEYSITKKEFNPNAQKLNINENEFEFLEERNGKEIYISESKKEMDTPVKNYASKNKIYVIKDKETFDFGKKQTEMKQAVNDTHQYWVMHDIEEGLCKLEKNITEEQIEFKETNIKTIANLEYEGCVKALEKMQAGSEKINGIAEYLIFRLEKFGKELDEKEYKARLERIKMLQKIAENVKKLSKDDKFSIKLKLKDGVKDVEWTNVLNELKAKNLSLVSA